MSQLVLKLFVSGPSGRWQDEDYDALADGKRWAASTRMPASARRPHYSVVPAIPNTTNGHAATLEESSKLGRVPQV
jgi:hypothetical protein